MFDFGTAGLTAAYVIVGLVLLSLHLYSSWSPWIKSAVTVVATAFFVVTYQSYPNLLGWPAPSDKLPSRLQLVGVETAEPDHIYLWARNIEDGLAYQPPRAYGLAYSKALHEQVAKAGKKMRRGIKMMVMLDPDGKKTLTEGTSIGNLSVSFIEAPEGLLPKKD